MTTDFLKPERKKYNFLEKLIQKKIKKTLYNNDKIRAWYLSFK